MYICVYMYKYVNTDRQMNGQTDGRTDGRMEGQTDRQTDRKILAYTFIHAPHKHMYVCML